MRKNNDTLEINNNKKIVIGVIIILLLVAFIFFMIYQKQIDKEHIEAQQGGNTDLITYTENNPKTSETKVIDEDFLNSVDFVGENENYTNTKDLYKKVDKIYYNDEIDLQQLYSICTAISLGYNDDILYNRYEESQIEKTESFLNTLLDFEHDYMMKHQDYKYYIYNIEKFKTETLMDSFDNAELFVNEEMSLSDYLMNIYSYTYLYIDNKKIPDKSLSEYLPVKNNIIIPNVVYFENLANFETVFNSRDLNTHFKQYTNIYKIKQNIYITNIDNTKEKVEYIIPLYIKKDNCSNNTVYIALLDKNYNVLNINGFNDYTAQKDKIYKIFNEIE